MAGFFSESAYRRLPSAVRNLPEKERATFIMMRMKRDEAFVARQLGVSINQAGELIRTVRETLVKSGALDLVNDPVFFYIDHPSAEPGGGAGRPFELVSRDVDVADKVALERFYAILEKSLEILPRQSRRLLSLWFNKDMKARDILDFYRKLGLSLPDGKPAEDATEHDVFYALDKNIKKLLKIVRTNSECEEMEITPASLKAILKETGV